MLSDSGAKREDIGQHDLAADHEVDSQQEDDIPVGYSPPLPESTGSSETIVRRHTSTPRLSASDVHNDYVPQQSCDGASSWSASADKQLGTPGSVTSNSTDRVFPIRSAISVDHTQTPLAFQGRKSSEHQEYFPPLPFHGNDGAASQWRSRRVQSVSESLPRISESHPSASHASDLRKSSASTTSSETGRYGGGSRMALFSDAASDNSQGNSKSVSSSGATGTNSVGNNTDGESLTGLITARFKHIITEGGHAVITGRDGETLQRCEDEPIHIPGAVQSFGLLIALEELQSGDLLVKVVSENSKRIIGYTPQELFKLKSFTDILSEEQCDNVLDHIDFIRDEEADPSTNGPEVFTISIRSPNHQKRTIKLWCAMHINPSNADLIICEFELDDDTVNPIVPASEKTPEPPEDTLNSQPTKDEYDESTHTSSKPLRVLRSARKRRGEAAAMEVFNIMSQVQEQLASAPNLESFLKILVGVVKELTGFHRVMVYQFDSTFNGRVVTELVDPRATKDLYKGLNFPASDIPKQARDLYRVNKVRLLYDRDQETARLVCRDLETLESPLDLTFSYLRAMSPIHIKYLANMAVRSSMSISINAFSELWGLIACHSYGSKGMRVSFPIRKMCRLVGDTASRNIERLSYASRLQARKLINTVPTEANPSGYIIASSDDLLKLFDADFGLLSIRGETKIMGKIDQSQEALAMLEYLRLRKITSVITSNDLKVDFPDLRYSPGFTVIAGLLLVPLSVEGSDFIVFFRKGQVKEVKWAGNPYEKFVKEGTEGYLEPRKSFKTWSETVVGKCREWTEEQVETSAVLCLVYGKFIEVWRQKEAAMQSSSLTKLLLSNSAHEVRTPLNAIINYLEIALEGTLDQETRENLSKSHSASKSLIYVINDLLDLTNTEEGQKLVKDEVFDLLATIREATDSFQGDAKRKDLTYDLIEHPGLPQFVHGDQRRVRQLVANVIANAVQHTKSGFVRTELWLQDINQQTATIEIIVQDSGSGMSEDLLDSLFRDLEQVSSESGGPGTELELANSIIGEKTPPRTLGLGLAMVARTVRNMDGQLRLKSQEGEGSRFVIQLPLAIAKDQASEDKDAATLAPLLPTASPVSDNTGEVTLVAKSNPVVQESINHKRSIEDIASMHSFRSTSSTKSNGSRRSDVDRLIEAISTPLSVGEPESEEQAMHRSNSKGSGRSRKSAASIGSAPGRTSNIQERPGKLMRAKSYGNPEHLRQTQQGPSGYEYITDTKTLLKAVKIPDEDVVEMSPTRPHGKVLFDLPDKQENIEASPEASPDSGHPRQQNADHLQVLVAEDDPVNSRIIIKRMEKSGHQVHHTVNGEDCSSAYGDKAAFFDVVLMDMQMPIVDGLTATRLIRSYEKSHPQSNLSPRAANNGRVPIFAVSASLIERERQTYIDAGFDGWILKPIDFKRLNVLLSGIVDGSARAACLYKAGAWERGGWFQRKQPSVFDASTKPSGRKPAPLQDIQDYTSDVSNHTSESGSITPTEPRRPLIHDERLDVPTAVPEEASERWHCPRV